jgi:hypothetical protein
MKGLAGEQSALASVAKVFCQSNQNCREKLSKPDDSKSSTNFWQEFKKFCGLKFDPLATLPIILIGKCMQLEKKRHHQEQHRRRQE